MNLEKTISAMKYIANSPAHKYGGFDPQTVLAAKAAVCYLTILDAWNKEVSNMQIVDKIRGGNDMATNLKKPCYDNPKYPCECYEDYDWRKSECLILLQGGAWEDCRFGKDWKEPEIKFEGD